MIRTAGTLVACLLAVAPALAQQPVYTVTGLGNLGYQYAFSSSLSENGQVVGSAYDMDVSTGQALQRTYFVYSQGVTTPLSNFGGLGVAAFDINSAGQVVGNSYTVDPSSGAQVYQRALLLSGGQAKDIGTLGGTRAGARAINELGQVTGFSRFASGVLTHAFVYADGVMTDLGAPVGGRSSGAAINNLGQVAGTVTLADGSVHIASFKAGSSLVDHGTFGSGFSSVQGINDLGQIVGYSETTVAGPNYNITHAFLIDGGVMQDLGSFAGKEFTDATGINNRSQIVGIAFSGDEFDNEVFLWENGQMFDLNALLDPVRTAGWTITGVYDINDRGQIAGDGILNGVRQAVLLTPVPELPAPALLAAGLAALAWRQRRRPATAA